MASENACAHHSHSWEAETEGDFCEFKVKLCSEFQTVLESETLSRLFFFKKKSQKKMVSVGCLSYLEFAEIIEFVSLSFIKCGPLFLPFSFYLSRISLSDIILSPRLCILWFSIFFFLHTG